MLTFDDLKEKLKHEDELTILELLNLTSIELVDILESYIEDKQEKLHQYFGDQVEDI